MTRPFSFASTLVVLIAGACVGGSESRGNVVVAANSEGRFHQADDRDVAPFEWSIPGTVHDENGNPVAGATVETLSGSQREMGTTSGDDGQFVLAMRMERPHGSPFVVSSPDGSLQSLVKQIGYNAPPRLTRVVLKPARKVTVSVKDKDGAALSGTVVNAVAEYCVVATGMADEMGQVTLSVPADARLDWVYGYLENHGFDYYENYATFPSRERLPLPDKVALTLDGSQTAKVRIVDSDEKPVPGVMVVPWTIRKMGKLSYINLSGMEFPETNESGIAEFAWMPASLDERVSFLIRHPKYHCPRLPMFESEGIESVARVLRVVPVRGKVTLADGSPVSGVHLQGEGRGDTNMYFRGHTVTREDGSYEFDCYPDQNTIIAVTDKFYAAQSHMDIRLKEGQSLENVDFVVDEGTLIRGAITAGVDRQPAAGDTATLIQSSGGTDLVRWSTTDANGNYRFRVGRGTYTLRLPHQQAGTPISVSVKDEKELVYDGHAHRKDRVHLSGFVTDGSGAPLASCDVYGESLDAPNHAGFRTVTNMEGSFNSERWSDRMIVYAIHGDRLLAGSAEITEDSTEVRLRLQPATSVSGVLRTTNNKPVANARVILNVGLPLPETTMSLSLSTSTDENGAYSFRGILPGSSCRVSFYRADQHTSGAVFGVKDLEAVELDDVVISDEIAVESSFLAAAFVVSYDGKAIDAAAISTGAKVLFRS